MNKIKDFANTARKLRNIQTLFYRRKYFTFLIIALVIIAGICSLVFIQYGASRKHSATDNTPQIGTQSEVADEAVSDNQDASVSASSEVTTDEGNKSSLTDNASSRSDSSPDSNPPAPIPVPEPSQQPQSPEPESPSATVAFYADTQTDENPVGEIENHRRTVNSILLAGANPVFHAGDLMEDGTQASLDYFNDAATNLLSTRTFYAALGNNDRKVGDSTVPSSLFLNNFSFPGNEKWYSVNIGNLHMIILDSAFSSANIDQRNWLIADLQSAASQSRITGVMYHHPTFASSIQQYLIDYGVDFVVAGHNHSYNHSVADNIHYFVTSGQPNIGYFIAKVYESSVALTVYGSSSNIVENVTINER